MSQNSAPTADLATQDPESAAVIRSNGVEQANWLSQLLARASRDDDLAAAASPLLRAVHDSKGPLNNQDGRKEEAPQTQASRKPVGALVNHSQLEDELSAVVQDRKSEAAQASWPNPDSALDLVRKAAEALAVMEERATALESYALKVVKEAREELAVAASKVSSYRERALAAEEVARELQTRLSESHERLSHSEERARHAEEEAEHAKTWMAHVNDVITSTLSNAVRDFSNSNTAPRADILNGIDVKLKHGRGRE